MKTFIYIVTNSSPVRGYNRSIRVYQMVKNNPVRIGDDERINTAAYKGDYAVACQIIADNTNLKMNATGYGLESKNVQVLDV